MNKKIYPWGILRLYDHPYEGLVDVADEKTVTYSVSDALKAMGKRKIRVAVFDTGVNRHARNGSLIKGGIDVINVLRNEDGRKIGKLRKDNDDNGHGTHVAGIIGAALDGDFEWGKKADVEIYVVKILDNNGTGDLSNVVMGLQWAIDNDIDIVNMSIGYQEDSSAVHGAIRQAHAAGIIMVAASGNRSNYDDSVVLKGLAVGAAGDGAAGDGVCGDDACPRSGADAGRCEADPAGDGGS